jgi:hypothetical protein
LSFSPFHIQVVDVSVQQTSSKKKEKKKKACLPHLVLKFYAPKTKISETFF